MADLTFGTDISGVTDLDKGFSLVSGPRCLAQAIARRLTTRRGGLFYAPDYGLDVRDMIEERQTAATIAQWQQAIANECEKDERVERATATVTLNTATNTAAITVRIETAAGPFRLTLAVTSLTVELLEV